MNDETKRQFEDNWDLVVAERVQRFLSTIGYQGDLSKIILTPVELAPNVYLKTMFEYACFDFTPKLTKVQREEGYVKLYHYNTHFSFVLDELDQYVIQDRVS